MNGGKLLAESWKLSVCTLQKMVQQRGFCLQTQTVFQRTIQIVHSDAFGDALRLSASISGIAIILSPLCHPYVILGSAIGCGKLRPMITRTTPKLKSCISFPLLVTQPSSFYEVNKASFWQLRSLKCSAVCVIHQPPLKQEHELQRMPKI